MTNDNYIVIKRPDNADTVSATGLPENEDFYGELTSTSDITVAEFWADVKELNPTSDDFGVGGTIRFNRRLEITADIRDTEAVDLDDTVTIDNDTNQYVVRSLTDSDWKWQRTITVEYQNR